MSDSNEGSTKKGKSLLQRHTSHKASGGDHGEGNWLVSYADLMTLLVGFFVILLSFSKVDQDKFEETRKQVSKQFGGKYEKPYEEIASKIVSALTKAGYADQVSVKTNDSGVEISFLGPIFFAVGSADIRDDAKSLLNALIATIKPEAADFKYVVEGHTDDVPLAGGISFKNNWELSSIRACRVLDYFLNQGFEKTVLTAIGYGETRPLVPNRDSSGKAIEANQSKNRRVIIRMIKEEQSL